MGMTEAERFHFDLAGFLVRPGILTEDEVVEIREQSYKIKHEPESLPPEHREAPGGPSSLLIDHPKVIEVLHEIIGPEIRVENVASVWRTKGEAHGDLHGGGPRQIDPIFGYRVQDGKIHAGMVRVIFEFTDIRMEDASTHLIAGSHKASFRMHPDHMSLEEGKRSPFLKTYECPAGSAVFFTENVCHAGPVWERDEPRVTILHAYAHLATHWHRLKIARAVLEGLPREKLAYFREPWIADFRTKPATHNTFDRFVDNEDPPVRTDHAP